MKDLKQFIKTTIREFINENYVNDNIKNYLIDGKYLFHYTLTDYLDGIKVDGLIPRKNPNSYYKDGSEILIEQKGKNPRKLTPREAARLQGFPDSFIIPVSDNQAYKQFGNSVAVPVIRAIAKKIWLSGALKKK